MFLQSASLNTAVESEPHLSGVFLSQGRAQYTMIFDHYDQVPQAVADEVKAKLA